MNEYIKNIYIADCQVPLSVQPHVEFCTRNNCSSALSEKYIYFRVSSYTKFERCFYVFRTLILYQFDTIPIATKTRENHEPSIDDDETCIYFYSRYFLQVSSTGKILFALITTKTHILTILFHVPISILCTAIVNDDVASGTSVAQVSTRWCNRHKHTVLVVLELVLADMVF